jgi:hypothetical protein
MGTVPGAPLHIPVSPDANVYGPLALALVSGFLFGLVPVRQVLRTDPYQIVKAGSASRRGRSMTARDICLSCRLPSAACWSLLLWWQSSASPALYTATSVLRRATPCSPAPGEALMSSKRKRSQVHKCIPPSLLHDVSPEYFRTARTTLLAGRSFSWYDDQNAAKVAIVNRDFARKMFGSVTNAVGRYYKRRWERVSWWWASSKTASIRSSPKIKARRSLGPSCHRH